MKRRGSIGKLVEIGCPRLLLDVAGGEADEHVVGACIFLHDIRVERVIVAATEVEQHRLRPLPKVRRGHPADVADAGVPIVARHVVEIAQEAEILSGMPVPEGDVERVEHAYFRHQPVLAEVDAVRAGEAPEAGVTAVGAHALVALLRGAVGVLVLEDREVVELGVLAVEDDVVGGRAVIRAQVQVRLRPGQAVGALRVADDDRSLCQ